MVYLMKSMLLHEKFTNEKYKIKNTSKSKITWFENQIKNVPTKFKIRISVIKMYALFFLPELMPLWWFGLEENGENQN